MVFRKLVLALSGRRQFLIGPPFQEAGDLGWAGFFNKPDQSPAVEGKLKAGAEVRTGETVLLRLHYPVFVNRAYTITISETLRPPRIAGIGRISRCAHGRFTSLSLWEIKVNCSRRSSIWCVNPNLPRGRNPDI